MSTTYYRQAVRNLAAANVENEDEETFWTAAREEDLEEAETIGADE